MIGEPAQRRAGHASRPSLAGSSEAPGSLEEMRAERVAAEAVRIAEERVREMFEVTEFDPDEVFGFMDSRQAAEFLGLPYGSFKEIAPSLPRCAITPHRYGYLRRELLAYFREQRGPF